MPAERGPARPETQTFLFADLAGYSALTEAHGDEHAADVAAEFVRSIRGLLEEHGGEQVKAIGDAVLVRIADPVELYALVLDEHVGVPLLENDPVCRMAVDPEHAAERITHRGSDYWFCSGECAERFRRASDRYVTA